MKKSLRETLVDRLNKAESTLNSALETGSDTVEARSDVDALKADLAKFDAEATESREAAESETQVQVEERATEIVQNAMDEIEAKLRELISKIVIPDVNLPPDLVANIQHALIALERTQGLVAKAQSKYDKVADRLQACKDERAAIVGRRAAGSAAEDDDRLILLAADVEGLLPLKDRAEDELSSINAELSSDQQRYDDLSAHWQTALRVEYLRCVTTLAGYLDSVYIKVVEASRDRQNSPGCVVGWRPSDAIRRLIAGY